MQHNIPDHGSRPKPSANIYVLEVGSSSARLQVALLALALSACGSSVQETIEDPLAGLPEYTEDGLHITYHDENGDGFPEVTKFYEQEVVEGTDVPRETLVRTELDLNSDGNTNHWRHYNEFGDLLTEDMDADLDGRIDRTLHWRDGTLTRAERDSNNDGEFDEFREYANGGLSEVRRDTNFNGTIDSWSFYDELGLLRLGTDLNADGTADRWTQRTDPE